MLVHFVKDEKTIDQVIDNFERVYSFKNRFLVFRENEDRHQDYFHIQQSDKVEAFFWKEEDISHKLTAYPEVHCIVLHGLYYEFAKSLLKIKSKYKLAWVMMGFDIYSLPRVRSRNYGKNSLKFLQSRNKFIKLEWFLKRHSILADIFYKYKGTDNIYKTILEVQKEVSYCISYVREDFEFVKRFYPYSYSFLEVGFYSLEQFVTEDFINSNIEGDNVLIGNSNSVTSNHLDVIELLPAVSQGDDRKFYVPLSYGEDATYRDAVIKRGKIKFDTNFKPLVDFIPKTQYLAILKSCAVGIFFHFRQQAMGNIIPMIWLGARIYFSIRNPLYQYFKRIGVEVFLLEKDFSKYGYSRLDPSLMIANRNALASCFSVQKVEHDFNNLVKILTKN